jgi:hypothetical protein
MRKPVLILSILFAVFGLVACSRTPVKPVNSPEVQRSHAHEAQDELSTGVRK